MAPHRSTTDAVWRQAVRNDLRHNQGKFVGVLLADLKQCYEHVRHGAICPGVSRRTVGFPSTFFGLLSTVIAGLVVY
eukprot:9049000-Pyramimonas_sp.AAC.1